MKILDVLVPRPGTRAAQVIDPGSGVVSDPTWNQPSMLAEDPDVMVYYEGNRYGAENLNTYEDRVACAAGRLDQHYPTIARGVFRRGEFDAVGTFSYHEDWRWHGLAVQAAEEPLVTWLGGGEAWRVKVDQQALAAWLAKDGPKK